MNEFILYATIILLAGVAAAKLAERLKIADVVLLLALGILLGPDALKVLPQAYIASAGDTIRELALIIIVFDAGYHLSWRILKREWFEVTKYVTLGCVFIMAVSAYFAHALFGIPYSLALLFGAIISATDPSATLSMLRGVKIPAKVKDTLEAESIANDPTGIIFTYIVLGTIASGTGIGSIKYAELFWAMAISVAVGAATGIISRAAMAGFLRKYSVLFSISVATATYVVSNALGGSGIFSAAISGAMLGRQDFPNKRTIVQFDDELATLMKIGVFIYLGAITRLGAITPLLFEGVLFALTLVFVIRPAMILAFASPEKFTFKERLYMGLVGPIAVVPAALAPLLLGFPGGERLVGAVFTTIVVSLLVVGGLLSYYNKALLGAREKTARSRKRI